MDSCDYAHGKWFWLQFYFMLSMATNFPFKFRVIHVHVVWKTVYNMLNPGRRGVASDIDEPYNLHLAYRVFYWLLTFYPKLQKVLKSSHFAATGVFCEFGTNFGF
ncbi:hypothetical protein NC651_001873 [Populus alba x Populus x berolinensis]|nr:hypothetical protein NC651_001873 [Populus alba x Populus x berolinensis]